MATHPACAERSLHRLGRRSTADSHRILILQLGWLNNLRLSPAVVAASSLRWLLPQPPACAGCCPHSRQTGGEPPTRVGCSTLRLHRFRFTRLAPDVSTSGWAFDAPLTSAEPCIGSLAADEYSLTAGSRTLRICQLNNFRLASALVSSGAASDPSRAFAPGFTLWLGWRRFSDSHRLFVPPTAPAINSRCPTGSSVELTVRPTNLWMQVQKSSKFVNFTRFGAVLR